MKTFLVLFITAMTAFPSFAGDLFMDEEFKAYEKAYWTGFLECNSLPTTMEDQKCTAKLNEKYKNDPRKRGRAAYVERQFGGIDDDALNRKVREYRVLVKKAPTFGWDDKRPYGTLSRKILASELNALRVMQQERAFVNRCEKEKKRGYITAVCQDYFIQKEVEEQMRQQASE